MNAQIILYDASVIGHTGLRDFVVDVADELQIPYQYDSVAGGELMRVRFILL